MTPQNLADMKPRKLTISQRCCVRKFRELLILTNYLPYFSAHQLGTARSKNRSRLPRRWRATVIADTFSCGLPYLKYIFDESNESVVGRSVDNFYWQYFYGFEFLQHQLISKDMSTPLSLAPNLVLEFTQVTPPATICCERLSSNSR